MNSSFHPSCQSQNHSAPITVQAQSSCLSCDHLKHLLSHLVWTALLTNTASTVACLYNWIIIYPKRGTLTSTSWDSYRMLGISSLPAPARCFNLLFFAYLHAQDLLTVKNNNRDMILPSLNFYHQTVFLLTLLFSLGDTITLRISTISYEDGF